MKQKPLQYESLKSVLLYIDANVRFRVSHRLPSIRSVEKTVPLRIRYLDLDEFRTIVDDHIYRFGIYREYKSGEEVPKLIQDENDKGGARHDLDQYGFQISSGHSVLDPGDVLLGNLRDEIQYDTPEKEQALEAKINRYEKAIYLLNNPEEVVDPEEEEYYDYGATMEAFMLAEAMKRPVESLKLDLDYSRTYFLPFECRRYNREPPYTCYIQLTVHSPSGKQIHRLPYRMKLYEAVKRFNTLLFGGRRSTLEVLRFHLDTSQTVLRLPVGFQVKMKYLSSLLGGLRGPYDGVISMIDPECLSLVEIQVNICRESDFQSPFIRSAKKLIIGHTSRRREMNQALINLPNHLISLIISDPEFTAEDYFELAQNWRNNDRPIGSCFSIGILQEKPVNALFRIMTERWEETKRNERYASIPTRNGNILEVFYEPKEEPRARHQWEFAYPDNWIFRVRIVGGE